MHPADCVRRCSKSSCTRMYTAVSALRRPPSARRSLRFAAISPVSAEATAPRADGVGR
jgi:hypothetical protein